MDFFYMPDLVKVIEHYLTNDNVPKTYDCVYEEKYKLLDIAMMVNRLSDYKVAVVAKSELGTDYIGEYKSIGINYIGLEEGIRQVYNTLK